MEKSKKEIAETIVAKLPEFSKFAADEAKIWENYGKVRIYFGRQSIEILEDGVVDCGKNPYGVSALINNIDGLSVK
jgi:hypothetical protein